MSLTMEALDESEAAALRPKMRLPYSSKVADLLRAYLLKHGPSKVLDSLITSNPGTDEQHRRLNEHYEAVADEVINEGGEQDLDELNMIALLADCSNRQRTRLAWFWTYWRGLLSADTPKMIDCLLTRF